MKSLSGVRIFAAAIAVCVLVGLSLLVHHGANGAVTKPEPVTSTRPGAAPSVRPQPGPGADRITTPPPGFTSFQMLNPAEVRDSPPAFATEAQVELAKTTNDEINQRITFRETRPWSIELGPRAEGDCVQYALTKRHVLRQAGVPDGAMRLVVVYAAKFRGLHIVLAMRTPANVYVLDSLENDRGEHFYPRAEMPSSYSLVEYQEWGKPGRWMAPAALVAENTPAMRQLHSKVARADNGPWH
jgi:predicted transglutaminase-like cysteine proteinase